LTANNISYKLIVEEITSQLSSISVKDLVIVTKGGVSKAVHR